EHDVRGRGQSRQHGRGGIEDWPSADVAANRAVEHRPRGARPLGRDASILGTVGAALPVMRARAREERNMKDLARLQRQVKAAWDRLPLDVKAKLGLKITAAHAYALALQSKTIAALPHPPHRELLMLHSLLNDPNATFAKAATEAPQGVLTYVGSDGQVYFGNVEYDSTDFEWAYCFPAMVLTDGPVPAFTVGKTIRIADNTTIALLGDW